MKYMTAILIASSLLLISCGNKKNDNEVVWTPGAGCEQAMGFSILCLPQATWTVVVLKDDFPSNIELKLNDYNIIDECSGTIGPFIVDRGSITNIIAQKFNYIDTNQQLKVEIIDKGNNCLGEKIYYLDDNQLFHVETIDDDMYVDIEIV